jgi:hypothetical protein
VGDWFVLRRSGWSAVTATGKPEDLPWAQRRDERVEVVAEQEAFGHECFVLQTSDLEMGTIEKVYGFRKYDLAFIGFLTHGPAGARRLTDIQAPAPAMVSVRMYFPVFPLRPGERVEYQTMPLRSATGEFVTLDETLDRLPLWAEETLSQSTRAEEITFGDESLRVVRVDVEEDGKGGKAVMRWLPGTPWWIQAWERRRPMGGYRTSLAASSWDTLPLDRVEAMLPDAVGRWNLDSVEEVPVPESLWDKVTAYHRAVAIRYARRPFDTQALTIWLLPNKFDEKAMKEPESRVNDGAAKQPRKPRVVYLGENYRALLMSPAKLDASMMPALKELTAVFEKHPDLTGPEYPLPRAAVGGKILEPE